jgi:hypothetical protein
LPESATSQVLEGFDTKLGLSDLKFRGLRKVEGSENTVTPRGMVLLGKLIVPQLAKIFIAIYEFPRFIVVSITARHLSLS